MGVFDIHRIKPMHGWREFVGEVGIIVIGVLIALTAEQVVEWAHWRDKVKATHHALRAELTTIIKMLPNACYRRHV